MSCRAQKERLASSESVGKLEQDLAEAQAQKEDQEARIRTLEQR